MKLASPLRFPGGKWRFAPFLERLIDINGLADCEYVEPYAGGASLALSLLLSDTVSAIHLNDLDPAIYAFWDSALKRTREFSRLIAEAPLNVTEWQRQKETYRKGARAGRLALGFATFYLNRTNHSGIMSGGIIGGRSQTGEWRMHARFNRDDLRQRIERLSLLRDRIRLYNEDALSFVRSRQFARNTLIYFDPPYFRPGKRALYLNAYDKTAHREVSTVVRRLSCPWLVSYDDVPEIRALYDRFASRRISLLHTAGSPHVGKEIAFFSHKLRIPRVHR
jgi:DNA adenine methylase